MGNPETITNIDTPLAILAEFDVGRILDGVDGGNRALTRVNQLGVATDWEAIRNWLKDTAGSPETKRSYRKEIERLLLWCSCVALKPLSDLTRADYEAYAQFLANPTPREAWCGPTVARHLPRKRMMAMSGKTKYTPEQRRALDLQLVADDRDPLPNPLWRPFVSGLSEAGIRRALLILRGLNDYLVRAGFLDGNPLAIAPLGSQGSMGQRSEGHALQHGDPRRRALTTEEWGALRQACEQMLQETTEQKAEYERATFVLEALYALGARIGELASHAMGSIVQWSDGSWRWLVTGKGGKDAWVPVNARLLGALSRYRTHLGLSPLPTPKDVTPFFLNLAGTKPVTVRHVYNIIKDLCAAAATLIEPTSPASAEKLRRASPHWIRHTFVTHLVDRTDDLDVVRRLARHDDLKTTQTYRDKSDDVLLQAIDTIG